MTPAVSFKKRNQILLMSVLFKSVHKIWSIDD